jgi:hypothetical protein
MPRPTLLLALALLLPSVAGAQRRSNEEWLRDCRDQDWDNRVVACDVQEFTLPARQALRVDGEQNGSITITGWDRNEIVVRARRQVWARSDADAKALLGTIRIEREGTIRADGERSSARNTGWAVSYDISVPRKVDLDLETLNGSIRVADVNGRLTFDATNGSITLENLAGDVRGETTNGSMNVTLAGTKWDGAGVDVRTTNGSVRLTIPEGFNARLETGTTNGGMNFDFPITIQGQVSRRITTDLGSGGPPIRAVTTNGSVSVRRR